MNSEGQRGTAKDSEEQRGTTKDHDEQRRKTTQNKINALGAKNRVRQFGIALSVPPLLRFNRFAHSAGP